MARGPFQGTYQPNARPVVVTAPDAFVLINNSTQITGCPSCNRAFDINKYITSIQVDLSVDSVPGSASIQLSVPRHTIDDFYFDGVPVISPMMEVNIYAKGYYLVEGLPQYYPIFWGLVTEVGDAYSSGEQTVSIHCADILKWWEICRMNVNPAYTSPVPSKFGITLNGNVFSGMNPFDIIWTLAQQAYGDIMIGGGSLVTLTQDSNQQKPVFMAALSDIMAYWSQRFQNISKNLMLYGSSGVCVRGDVLQEQMLSGKNGQNARTLASRTVRVASGGSESAQMLYDPSDPNVTAFRTNSSNLGVNFWQSEFQTKLELANAAKEAIGYEFYMDVTGDIVFKPPFYNLDILSNKPVSWIQDIDVVEWDFDESEAEVVTQLTVQGNFSGNVDWGWPAEMTPFTNVTDYHLLRKYGWRPAQLNSEFMGGGGDALSMFYYGLDVLDRMNAKRHRGTVTIPFRPELRMGFPIYVAGKDQIWYIQGISHNIAFGGRATTTLSLTARREKFKAPQGIGALTLTNFNSAALQTPTKPNPGGSVFAYTGKMLSQAGSFTLKVGDAATLPANPNALSSGDPSNNPYQPLILRDPRTGRILGYPNVVMAYLQPYAANLSDWEKSAGYGNVSSRLRPTKQLAQNLTTSAQRVQQQLVDNADSKVTDKHLTNRSWFGLTSAGSFVYAHDLGQSNPGGNAGQNVRGVIGDLVLLPAGHLTTTPTSTTDTTAKVNNATVMVRPVSDERGFETIGHYRYGRGLTLSDGQLVQINTQDTYKAANVAIQVALSGNMFASLTAQAQGLTGVTSPYANPVDAIASLQPEDLRTSGFTTPNTDGTPGLGQAQYGNTQPNFASLPVYGSPQVTGVFQSVEASQLSQGLTLAEMTVIDQQGSMDGTNQTQVQCMCLLGRSDLAFINTGYQVKTLNGTTADPSQLYNPNGFAAGGAGTSTISSGTATFPPGLTNPTDQAEYTSALLQGNPLNPAVSTSLASATPDQVTTIIDQFLWNLYSALDGPHESYEQLLRGGIYETPQPGSTGTLQVGPTATSLGDLTPPFSSPNRFALGDPKAAALQGSTALSNMSAAWTSFGQNLQTNTQIANLSTSVASDRSNLTQLQQQLTRLQAGLQPGSTVVGSPPIPEQIASLQTQINALTNKINTENLQLGQLRAEQSQQTNPPNLSG